MLELVEANIPIVKQVMKTRDALKLFESHGMFDKTKLFGYRIGSYVNVYSLEGYNDYYYGYMAASTGILKYFELYKFEDGFVLQLPVKENPVVVPEFKPQRKLFNILKETSEWADMLDVHTVGSLNEHIVSGDINSLVLVQEALQEQKIVEIVKMIQTRKETKFVMIAGPSSSGKTTFSHRLSIQLRANGYKPHPICVDDYFVERDRIVQ
jgi:uridine kinase